MWRVDGDGRGRNIPKTGILFRRVYHWGIEVCSDADLLNAFNYVSPRMVNSPVKGRLARTPPPLRRPSPQSLGDGWVG